MGQQLAPYAEARELAKHVETDGAFGEIPEWWNVVQAARYLGVAPWDLLAQPTIWTHIALAAQQVGKAWH